MATRVSILLPAYCAEATLAAALRSIQRQTETCWECVVVDDGSSDATAAVARGFAERDPRFLIRSLGWNLKPTMWRTVCDGFSGRRRCPSWSQ